ncbi:hypothetical protein QBC37DRAFT_405684 [Rhypophila decipiens]|uniref:Uncharacterized protein n=1 Tax=Rhypophila decipiens TaxID=261697 RepID=A0AAN6XWQ7_9PEZI|nr:hypothetical protein QBC37DRAFT_405684 [Rhypophila decipiens]
MKLQSRRYQTHPERKKCLGPKSNRVTAGVSNSGPSGRSKRTSTPCPGPGTCTRTPCPGPSPIPGPGANSPTLVDLLTDVQGLWMRPNDKGMVMATRHRDSLFVRHLERTLGTPQGVLCKEDVHKALISALDNLSNNINCLIKGIRIEEDIVCWLGRRSEDEAWIKESAYIKKHCTECMEREHQFGGWTADGHETWMDWAMSESNEDQAPAQPLGIIPNRVWVPAKEEPLEDIETLMALIDTDWDATPQEMHRMMSYVDFYEEEPDMFKRETTQVPRTHRQMALQVEHARATPIESMLMKDHAIRTGGGLLATFDRGISADSSTGAAVSLFMMRTYWAW